MTLLFFEIACCCLLRFEISPSSTLFHGRAAALFFALMWFLSFHVLLIDRSFVRRLLKRRSIPEAFEGR